MIKLLIRVFALSAAVLAFMLLGVSAWGGFVRSLKLDPQDESALVMITPVLILIFYWWLFGLFKGPGDEIK
jgi:hypothetical protein